MLSASAPTGIPGPRVKMNNSCNHGNKRDGSVNTTLANRMHADETSVPLSSLIQPQVTPNAATMSLATGDSAQVLHSSSSVTCPPPPLQVLGLTSSASPGSLALMSPSLLLNQPIFVAISTNPLILVPCSYNATTGGLNFANTSQPVLANSSVATSVSESGLLATVPRTQVSRPGRALSPSRPASPHSLRSGSSLFPFPENEQPLDLTSRSGHVARDASLEEVVKNITLANSQSQGAAGEASASRIQRRRNSNAMVIAPGSSFMNKPPHQSPYHNNHNDHNDTTTDDNNSRSSCCSPPGHGLSLPIAGLSLPGHMSLMASASASLPASVTERQALVKQGTYRCKDCNIVFYKHENFLVHKSMYCASRRSSDLNNASSPSPEPPESDHAPNSSPDPDLMLDSKPVVGHMSPNSRSITSTPPLSSPPPLAQHHAPVFQFFCVACGIRFTSLDTLHAHQAFYCLKRSVANQGKNGPTDKVSTADSKHVMEDSGTDGTACPAVAAPVKSCPSHSNLQAFKCTICGYKGHTMRGMRTHVRIHQDKMQGLSEESFIEYIENAAVERKTVTSGPGSRGRRRSLEPTTVQDRQSVTASPSSKRRRQAIPCLRYN